LTATAPPTEEMAGTRRSATMSHSSIAQESCPAPPTEEMVGSRRSATMNPELQGFNRTSTRPWRYINLNVTFGEGTGERTVEKSFLVVPVTSVYNCILGRPTLAALALSLLPFT